MASKIYVDNLPIDMTEDRLKDVFAQIGEVQSVKITKDLLTLLTDHPKGHGIVEMTLEVDAYRAVNVFDGATFKDRKIHLEETKPLIDKAKSMFEHIADGSSLAGFVRWKDQFKNR
jgi:RNA recognition motif-containing protein